MSLTKVDSRMVEFTPAGTGAVVRDVQTKLRESVSVKDFGAVGDGITDDTAAIQAAFDAVLSIGNSVATFQALLIPEGEYKVTTLTLGHITGAGGSPATKDLYYKKLICHGRILGTNASGPVLNIEGMLGVEMFGLFVKNTASTAGARAVTTKRSYAVNWWGCKFQGGEAAFELQGNSNNFFGAGFTYSGTGFLQTGDLTNCKNNSLIGCDLEKNTVYNVNINRVSGSYPELTIRDCYIEAGAVGFLGHVRIRNSIGVTVEQNYFSHITSCDGVIFSGTVVTNEYNNSNRVRDNNFVMNAAGIKVNCLAREAGTAFTAMGMVWHANNKLDGLVTADTVLGTTGEYTGSANAGMTYAVNSEGERRRVGLVNADFSSLVGALGSAPNSWTSSGGAAATSSASISDYGTGNTLEKTGGTYVKQLVKVRPKTLYRVTGYMASTGATIPAIQIWDAGIATPKLYVDGTASATPTLFTGYYYSGFDTSIQVLLRDKTGGGGNAQFADIQLIDLTN